jgi:hypothetical protein
MAFDLLSIFLTTGAEWATKKALEVAWKCLNCGDPNTGRIENVTYNQYYCHNCRTDKLQFTNASARTVGPDGHINAQIGIRFGSFEHIRDRGPILGDLLGWKCTHVQAPVSYLCEGLGGQDLIEVNDITDLKTGRHILTDTTHFVPRSNSASADRWLVLPRHKMREDDFIGLFDNDALLAFDTRVENRFRDVLIRDRKLHQL